VFTLNRPSQPDRGWEGRLISYPLPLIVPARARLTGRPAQPSPLFLRAARRWWHHQWALPKSRRSSSS